MGSRGRGWVPSCPVSCFCVNVTKIQSFFLFTIQENFIFYVSKSKSKSQPETKN